MKGMLACACCILWHQNALSFADEENVHVRYAFAIALYYMFS